MRKRISQFTSSFAALLSEQDTEKNDVNDRLESIRNAMLEALFDIDQISGTKEVWSAVVCAIEIQTLWYLRSDLLQHLAKFWGEPVAREKLGEITKLFQGVVANHQLQGRKRSGSESSTKKSRPVPLAPITATLDEELRDSAQDISPLADVAPTSIVEDQSSILVDGLNVVDAITAHQKWKVRLMRYVTSTSSEKLEYSVVCRDDQCELGKWINDRGGKDYGHFPIFSQLKIRHAQFHMEAGAIIRLVDEGNLKQAQMQLRQGEYARHSVKVQGLLSSLYVGISEVNRSLIVRQ